MTTTTLSFKKRFGSLVLGMLKKNIATAGYLFAIFFIFFPLQMILETRRALEQASTVQLGGGFWQIRIATASGLYTDFSAVMVVLLLLSATVIVGLVQFSYLHSHRAVDLYHSLPVSRPQLMAANTIVSFLTVMVPFFLNWLINLGVCVYRVTVLNGMKLLGISDQMGLPGWEILWDILGWQVAVFGVLAVVIFVGMQVGSIFEHFVFSCEVLLTPIVVYFVNSALFSDFLTGYTISINGKLATSLSPATFMVGRCFDGSGTLFYNWMTFLWLLLGVGIYLAAMLLYSRRKSELAESAGCRGPLGVLLAFFWVYLVAPAFGAMLYGGLDDSRAAYVAGVLVGGVVVFLLLSAILNRGFAGIRKKFPQGIAICAVVTAVAVVVVTGGAGFENRVPKATDIKSVTINNRGWYSYAQEADNDSLEGRLGSLGVPSSLHKRFKEDVTLTQPDAVELVLNLHRTLTPLNQSVDRGEYQNTKETMYHYQSIRLDYQTNAGRLRRSYDAVNAEVFARLGALEETADFQAQTNPLLRLNPDHVVTLALHNNLGFLAGKVDSDVAQRTQLLAALKADAEKNGTRDFTAGSPIRAYVWVTMVHYSTAEALAFRGTDKVMLDSFCVPVFDSYTNTLAALEEICPDALTSDISQITRVGMDTSNWDKGSDYFVSTVGSNIPHDYSASDTSYFPELVRGRVDFSRNSNNNGYVFCTLYRNHEQGATFMFQADQLSPAAKAELPALAELYETQGYAKSGQGYAKSGGIIGGADGPTAIYTF